MSVRHYNQQSALVAIEDAAKPGVVVATDSDFIKQMVQALTPYVEDIFGESPGNPGLYLWSGDINVSTTCAADTPDLNVQWLGGFRRATLADQYRFGLVASPVGARPIAMPFSHVPVLRLRCEQLRLVQEQGGNRVFELVHPAAGANLVLRGWKDDAERDGTSTERHLELEDAQGVRRYFGQCLKSVAVLPGVIRLETYPALVCDVTPDDFIPEPTMFGTETMALAGHELKMAA